jgi:ParB family chromosome partitioning protein
MVKKGGLGRGLEALIPVSSAVQTPADSGGLDIPIDDIIPNPRQPRHIMAEDELSDLANSIRENGILQPLILTQDPNSDKYILIAGERRWRAARLAGLSHVPAVLRQATDQQRLVLALIENLQRADLTPLEAAEAYRHLLEDFNLSHEEVAARVGKNRVTITNTLRLLKLPQSVLKALAAQQITEGHARALLGLPSAQSQVAALQIVLKQALNVRQTEELVRRLTGDKPAARIPARAPPEIQELEDRLRSRLGTKVSLKHGKKGGSLVIHYYSDEELESIIAQIMKE